MRRVHSRGDDRCRSVRSNPSLGAAALQRWSKMSMSVVVGVVGVLDSLDGSILAATRLAADSLSNSPVISTSRPVMPGLIVGADSTTPSTMIATWLSTSTEATFCMKSSFRNAHHDPRAQHRVEQGLCAADVTTREECRTY